MATKPERAQTLAAHVREERADRLGSKAAAVRAARVSRNTWDRLEAGAPTNDYTYVRLEAALGWPRGSVQRYLDGDGDLPRVPDEEPVTSEDTPEGAMRVESVPGLPPQVLALFATEGAETTAERVTLLAELVQRVVASAPPSEA